MADKAPQSELDHLVDRHVANIDAFLAIQVERDTYRTLSRDLAKTLDGFAHKKLYQRCKDAGLIE